MKHHSLYCEREKDIENFAGETLGYVTPVSNQLLQLCTAGTVGPMRYRIFPAIRRGFRPSRMTLNNLISPVKFCYKTNSTLPKQCQSSRSVLEDGSRTFGLFWKEKTPSYN